MSFHFLKPNYSDKKNWRTFMNMGHNVSKLCNQVRSLDYFVVQNSGDFLCWKYKEVVFQTCFNSQLLRRVLWISAEQTIGASLKHKNTQPLYIFNRENPQNSEPQNGPRSGLDYIPLLKSYQEAPSKLQKISGQKSRNIFVGILEETDFS